MFRFATVDMNNYPRVRLGAFRRNHRSSRLGLAFACVCSVRRFHTPAAPSFFQSVTRVTTGRQFLRWTGRDGNPS